LLNFYNASISGEDIAFFEKVSADMAMEIGGDMPGTVCMGGDPNPFLSLADRTEERYRAFVETMSFEGNSDDLRYNSQTKAYEAEVYVATPAVFDHETGTVSQGSRSGYTPI
jgi:hypothetical protein